MNSSLWLRYALFMGLCVLLVVTPINAIAGDLINGFLTISEQSEQEVYPSMAFNSTRGEYLIVWYNDRAGCDDIRAQRLSATGELLGSSFYVLAGCNLDRRYPDVAYNSVHDQYLVVWEENDPSTTWNRIQGRRISGAGLVLDAADITIRSASNLYTPFKPAVAYASTSDRYLVVWAETWHPMPIQYDIYGQVITDSGALEGSRFSISNGTDIREEPDIAYNRHANRYLVVWQQKSGSLYDVHGHQVHGGGGLYQGDMTIAFFTSSSINPAVAAIPTTPTNTKFLVVWQLLHATNDHDIYGRLVEEDGTNGNHFWISWETSVDETNPAISASEDNLQYFVSWQSPQGILDNPIKGKAIFYNGTLLGDVVEFSGVAADNPAVSAGSAGDILVAWQDQPISVTNTNIYARLWGNRVYLPLIIRN